MPAVGAGGLRRAALLTTGLTLAGALLGVVRDLVIAVVFGAGPAVDAFLVAQGLMNLVLGLVAGALAKSAVPVVSRAADDGRPADGLRSVRAALGLAIVVLALGGLTMWLGAAGVVAVLAPGFTQDTAATAVELTRIVLVAAAFVAATNLLAGAAQALGRFGAAAGQGLVFNVVMITAALVAGPLFGIEALAWGFVLGSAARLVLQLPSVRGFGVRPLPSVRWRDPGLVEMLRLMPALLVGSAVSNVNTLVDRAVASTVSEGAVAALNFAARLVSTVDMLLIATLVAALYPRMAAAAAPGRRDELRGLVGTGVGALVAALAPVAVVIALGAEPLVRLVFGYGAFDSAAVTATAAAAGMLAAGLPALAVREVAIRAAYGLGDGAIPVRTALAAVVVNVVGDLLLAPRFGVAGIAAATVVSGVVGAVSAAVWLRHRHGAFPPVGRLLAGVGCAAAAGALLGWPARSVATGLFDGAPQWAASAGVLAAIGCAVLAGYLVVLRLLQPQQFHRLVTLRPGR